MIKNSTTNQLI